MMSDITDNVRQKYIDNYIINNSRFNENILNLNYKCLPKIQLRSQLKYSLSEFYYIPEIPKEKIVYIGKVNNMLYNLSHILRSNDTNIITDFIFEDPYNVINDSIIIFSILYKQTTIISISNLSITNLKHKLCDYFEYYFVDINNYDQDLTLNIEFTTVSNHSILPITIKIFAKTLSIPQQRLIKKHKKNYSQFTIYEDIRFYTPQISQNINKTYKDCLVLPNKTAYYFNNDRNVQLNISYINKSICNPIICPIIYFSFLWTNDNINFPKIKNISVIIKDYIIEFNSSRINVNNEQNFHFINFYPGINLINKESIYGLNITDLAQIKIEFEFEEDYAIHTQICVGLLIYKLV